MRARYEEILSERFYSQFLARKIGVKLNVEVDGIVAKCPFRNVFKCNGLPSIKSDNYKDLLEKLCDGSRKVLFAGPETRGEPVLEEEERGE